jgi:hypothetical protein
MHIPVLPYSSLGFPHEHVVIVSTVVLVSIELLLSPVLRFYWFKPPTMMPSEKPYHVAGSRQGAYSLDK